MKKIILITTLLTSLIYANNTQGCVKVKLGLYDEILSCKNGDYHVKYAFTMSKNVDAESIEQDSEFKKVLSVTTLREKNSLNAR